MSSRYAIYVLRCLLGAIAVVILWNQDFRVLPIGMFIFMFGMNVKEVRSWNHTQQE